MAQVPASAFAPASVVAPVGAMPPHPVPIPIGQPYAGLVVGTVSRTRNGKVRALRDETGAGWAIGRHSSFSSGGLGQGYIAVRLSTFGASVEYAISIEHFKQGILPFFPSSMRGFSIAPQFGQYPR